MVSRPDIFKHAAGQLIPAIETVADFKENALLMGIQSGSVESVYRATSAAKFAEIVKKAQKEEKERREQMVWLDLLDQAKARLAELDASIASRLERLKDKYGEDPITGMGHTYLSPEEMEELETPDEIMAALADKYLDENGNLKPEYVGVLGPDELAVIQEWQERQKLKPIVEAADKATAENNGVVPEEHGKVLEKGVQEFGIEGSKDMLKAGENQAVAKEIVSIDNEDSNAISSSGGLSLGDIG